MKRIYCYACARAQVTDIVIIVVAADDGKYATNKRGNWSCKAAGVPIVAWWLD